MILEFWAIKNTDGGIAGLLQAFRIHYLINCDILVFLFGTMLRDHHVTVLSVYMVCLLDIIIFGTLYITLFGYYLFIHFLSYSKNCNFVHCFGTNWGMPHFDPKFQKK